MTEAKKLLNTLNNMLPTLDNLPTMMQDKVLVMLRVAYLAGYEMHRAEYLHIKQVLEEEKKEHAHK